MTGRRTTRRKPRVQRTPEQIALTCKSAMDAFKHGIEVHRAYIQGLVATMTPREKELMAGITEKITNMTTPQEQSEALRAVAALKTEADITEFINKGDKNATSKIIEVGTDANANN